MDDTMKRLVLVIGALSLAGLLVGAGYYYTVQLPTQHTLAAPTNDGTGSVGIPAPVQPGNIQVWTTPGNSHVCVDGSYCKNTTSSGSAIFTQLTANTNHTVTVTADKYQPYSATVFVTSQNQTTLYAILQPLKK